MNPDEILETTSRAPRLPRPAAFAQPPAQPAPSGPPAPPAPQPKNRQTFLFIAVVVATGGWLALLALSAATPVLGALALGAAYLACVAIILTPTFRPGLPPQATLLLALSAAAVVPVLAVVADVAGLVRVPTELVLVVTVAAVVAALAAYIARRSIPIAKPALPSPTPAPPSSADPRHGRYRLVRRLGVGGMGEVWRAEHDTLARPAALKLIRRKALEDPKLEREMLERFRKEAEVTAQLSSPHTVVLYDFGVTADGALYYAMELLQGMSILALVQKYGPMHDARVAFLMRHACHSLQEAHEAGLVHRDLKPENLFIAHLGRDKDFLKVLDFGLVKELDQPLSTGGPKRQRVQLTVAGARPGTPGFMAPEQITGTAALDQRADIYALGCVMYYALTGTPVFRGDVEAQILFAHVDTEPDRPSVRVGRPIHPELENVVMRCLAKDPTGRPTSMDAVEHMLAAIPFAEPWSQDLARRWWAERKIELPP